MHVKVPQFAYEYVEKARLWFTIRRLSIVPGIVGKEILCVKKKKSERNRDTRTAECEERGVKRGTERAGEKGGGRSSGAGKLSLWHSRGNQYRNINEDLRINPLEDLQSSDTNNFLRIVQFSQSTQRFLLEVYVKIYGYIWSDLIVYGIKHVNILEFENERYSFFWQKSITKYKGTFWVKKYLVKILYLIQQMLIF